MEPPPVAEADVDVPTRRRTPIAARHYLWLLGAAIVLFAALHWLGPVLTPFLVGAILAYLGNPIVNRCERAGMPRTIGTLIAVALLMLAILALVVVIVPLVQAELGLMIRRLPELGERFTRDVAPWIEQKFGIAVALSAVGLRFAFPIGLLTGLLVFIPYVGFGLGLVLAMLAALLQWNGWPGFLAVAGVYGVGQIIENYVLVPYLVGDRIGLHPLAVIFALLAFGQLFGFAGVLLALPISAALLVALRRARAAYVASPLYREP